MRWSGHGAHVGVGERLRQHSALGRPLSHLPHGGWSASELHKGAAPPEVEAQTPFGGVHNAGHLDVLQERRMSTLLMAAVRSRATSFVRSMGFGLLKPVLIFCTITFNTVVVECPRVKPCWWSARGVDVLGPLAGGASQQVLLLVIGARSAESFLNFRPIFLA